LQVDTVQHVALIASFHSLLAIRGVLGLCLIDFLCSIAKLFTTKFSIVFAYRRGMAGAYPADMAVKKNKFMEEWNGQREITLKTFSFEFTDFPTFAIFIVLIPYGMYTWCRSELMNGTDRRYKEVF
jgi:hypothetical protein